MPQDSNSIILCLLWLSLSGCGSYDVTVNERLVYSPAPLFSAFEVADSALQQCLEQAIVDGEITRADQLHTLNCSHAGISELSGIEQFTAITHLKLSSNNIVNLAPLSSLDTLTVLQLDDNQLADSSPLGKLTTLKQLNLAGNPRLQCPGAQRLVRVDTLTLPEHCQ